MRKIYKGFILEVRRELSMAGYGLLYTTVITPSGLYYMDDAEDRSEDVRERISQLKEMVDEIIECPEDWGLNENFDEIDEI